MGGCLIIQIHSHSLKVPLTCKLAGTPSFFIFFQANSRKQINATVVCRSIQITLGTVEIAFIKNDYRILFSKNVLKCINNKKTKLNILTNKFKKNKSKQQNHTIKKM